MNRTLKVLLICTLIFTSNFAAKKSNAEAIIVLTSILMAEVVGGMIGEAMISDDCENSFFSDIKLDRVFICRRKFVQDDYHYYVVDNRRPNSRQSFKTKSAAAKYASGLASDRVVYRDESEQ